jgi:hypothetical protein
MDLELAASFWALQLLRSEELPGIAVDALEAGVDTPALRILAGERSLVARELDPLFEKVLVELKFEVPSRQVAMMTAAKHYAGKIVSGDWSPYKGTSAICSLCWDEDAPRELMVFVGLLSEYGDFEYRAKHDNEASRILQEIEQQIVAEARSILKNSGKSSE